MGSCLKIYLCADLEDVRLDLDNLKIGSGNVFFERCFGLFSGTVGVFFCNGWVTHPQLLGIGWADANWFVCNFGG